MKIRGYESVNAVLSELGSRLKQYRISAELTQKDLAEKSGVSMSTVVRMENGEDLKVSNIIRVLMALNIGEKLDYLIPEPEPDYEKMFNNFVFRERVGRKKKSSKEWIWGEDKK